MPTSGRWVAACDLTHRGQLNALVDQMPEDPDAAWSMSDDPGYELQIEDVARCCRARRAFAPPTEKTARLVVTRQGILCERPEEFAIPIWQAPRPSIFGTAESVGIAGTEVRGIT